VSVDSQEGASVVQSGSMCPSPSFSMVTRWWLTCTGSCIQHIYYTCQESDISIISRIYWDFTCTCARASVCMLFHALVPVATTAIRIQSASITTKKLPCLMDYFCIWEIAADATLLLIWVIFWWICGDRGGKNLWTPLLGFPTLWSA
jgi:hypothetical protein